MDSLILISVLLTSSMPARFVNATARGPSAWRAMHDEWFQHSSNGIHIETGRSRHHLQDEEPELVARAIRFVLERVRAQAAAGR
jgi:hypothetical protein